MTPSLTDRLTGLKREAETAREQTTRKQGELDGLLGRLKSEFKLPTPEAAAQALEKKRTEVVSIRTRLEAEVTRLEAEMRGTV